MEWPDIIIPPGKANLMAISYDLFWRNNGSAQIQNRTQVSRICGFSVEAGKLRVEAGEISGSPSTRAGQENASDLRSAVHLD
jgi:hypothetical protein